ncbi:MAG: TetR/AcrR family transcriptional regulator [Deltaproteobacteria bacterium]|jgi:AcrR family transcriptional regulator|nr:TetR/AcrR family transcriptional regulator [Deltaproteobacteria bacterium]MBT4637493.1 TetR/AcrR family transcriptional regulator [Deltaproteobacteria bacterium]MBT6500837.1 TetR/AcrR family transcriptional regulator [Deltaproteobacteria bacterium]MBT6612715.1 TetR/AcrR family transcriptional regulator [Deltaproteobacteria bacterium]MBT7153758.1 TetR/AcrR family transcriptional regulator [Deltaproteobacteria bacterium]
MKQPQKRLSAEERRKIILKSAVKVFGRSNYRAAKMADIGAESGVSEAMVYKHFPSKKAIFLRILQHISDRIIIIWEAETEKNLNALSTLKNMGLAYYHRMKDHPDELKVQFQAISEIDDEDIASQLRQDHIRYIEYFESILKKGVREGSIRPDIDSRVYAFLLNGSGITLNMMQLLALNIEFIDNHIDQFLDQYIELIA